MCLCLFAYNKTIEDAPKYVYTTPTKWLSGVIIVLEAISNEQNMNIDYTTVLQCSGQIQEYVNCLRV